MTIQACQLRRYIRISTKNKKLNRRLVAHFLIKLACILVNNRASVNIWDACSKIDRRNRDDPRVQEKKIFCAHTRSLSFFLRGGKPKKYKNTNILVQLEKLLPIVLLIY